MQITSLRLFIPRLAITTALGLLFGSGCANRGMVAPSEGGGSGGALTGEAGAGTGGGAGAGAGGGNIAAGGKGGGTAGAGGMAGAGGKGGGSGGSNMDASCSVVTDALFDHSTTSCGATFNFEGSANTEGAKIVPGGAFTGISQATPPHTYCGTGALAIAATFTGTVGAFTKGEVDIPLGVDGGTADLSGKTLTVHASANPASCGEDLRLSIILNTSIGSATVSMPMALTSNFETISKPLAAVAGSNTATALAIVVQSVSSYTGTIYVDEIDLK